MKYRTGRIITRGSFFIGMVLLVNCMRAITNRVTDTLLEERRQKVIRIVTNDTVLSEITLADFEKEERRTKTTSALYDGAEGTVEWHDHIHGSSHTMRGKQYVVWRKDILTISNFSYVLPLIITDTDRFRYLMVVQGYRQENSKFKGPHIGLMGSDGKVLCDFSDTDKDSVGLKMVFTFNNDVFILNEVEFLKDVVFGVDEYILVTVKKGTKLSFNSKQ